MSRFADERGAELRDLFFETAQELLQSLNDGALKLEKTPDDLEVVREIRRAVHTLKGDAAACSFRELSEAAHEFEDALALEVVPAGGSLAEVAFAAADTFAAMLTAYRSNKKPRTPEAFHKMVRKLAATAAKENKKKAAKATKKQSGWTEYEELAIRTALQQGKRVFHIVATIDVNCGMPIAARQLVMNALRGTGEALAVRPEATSALATKRVELLVSSEKSSEQVAAKCAIPTVVSDVRIEPVVRKVKAAAPQKTESAPAPESSSEPVAASEVSAEQESGARPVAASPIADTVLRVDAERIDSVLNLVGELIIGKSMLHQSLNELARRFPKDPLRHRFADAMAFQARVLNDLQRSVMKIRMVPVDQLFRRFPRMVRDVAKQCGRQVDLVLTGQDTDLDKSLLDSIAEPLTHLVRNAIGHGIESPEDRAKTGKPAQGKLHLNAYHHGNQVIIEVTDDGRGIDSQKVKAKAIQLGLLTAETAAHLNEGEILELIFRPGFSTADQVTEIAGRGVGLDVVQSVLLRMKGLVEVVSRPGQGTTFRMKLPLTLAIIKALLFRVEQRLYAVPLNAVAEITRAHESDLHQVDRFEVLQLRNKALPMVRLGRHPDQESASRKIFVLVISVGERKLGLIVDALEGEEELVIKALDDKTVETDLVSGASILGDGRVVLILNLAAVIDRSIKGDARSEGKVISGLLLSHSDRVRLGGELAEVRQ